ncbi:conserved hypothetical protein [Paraburkholderia ribeironis]|uniref:Uncharacterized protein n=1 Tax=Paraburkholderia ribeironis TaxID=1247936 RepID=A0A1N7SM12_9BURK|nr:heavy-metal-associated domain-containing protein [Paraburkholderia ribeironis]SIT48410.1 conserved hypothetical protein [Paraburkholderia ribeironis]
MVAFEVNEMTCGHGVGSITEAPKAVDNHAKFNFDPARHLVSFESTDADPNELRDTIADPGSPFHQLQRLS